MELANDWVTHKSIALQASNWYLLSWGWWGTAWAIKSMFTFELNSNTWVASGFKKYTYILKPPTCYNGNAQFVELTGQRAGDKFVVVEGYKRVGKYYKNSHCIYQKRTEWNLYQMRPSEFQFRLLVWLGSVSNCYRTQQQLSNYWHDFLEAASTDGDSTE